MEIYSEAATVIPAVNGEAPAARARDIGDQSVSVKAAKEIAAFALSLHYNRQVISSLAGDRHMNRFILRLTAATLALLAVPLAARLPAKLQSRAFLTLERNGLRQGSHFDSEMNREGVDPG
jgi:predicted 2-oxoglutarate/Fe(II)-dependent dioxygenase YbiX